VGNNVKIIDYSRNGKVKTSPNTIFLGFAVE